MARSAVVTGSSSGIGRAIAARLAADGFWVLLADIRRDPVTGGEPTDDLIRASGGACEYLAADVSDRHECDRLVTRAVAHAGRLDVLVNNAALAGRHSRPLLGTEDEEIVAPAIAALRNRGIQARGPLPADTMFHEAARNTYDCAICMYHDQALIPIKTIAFDDAVNVTLGLPFVRTSPDHGTAFDIAG